MKIILSGGTGFIGGEALRQAIRSPEITSIVVLSRRKLEDPEALKSSKVKTIIVKDFWNYSDDVIQDIQGAEAAIWALGSINFFNEASYTEAHEGFTMAAAKACVTRVAPNLPSGKEFRFIKVSGHGTEKDQSKTLWLLSKLRKMGGRLETDLAAYGDNQAKFKVIITRPNVVLNEKRRVSDYIKTCITTHVGVDELGAALVELAIHGGEKQFYENEELADNGRKLLAK